MNTVPASQIPDENAPDERTATESLTAGGEGWSEDMELAPSHPGIHVTAVHPGIVATDFGLNARHGGPDSRSFPESQSAEQVAAVIAKVIETRQPDVYTRPAQKMIANYYATIGVDA